MEKVRTSRKRSKKGKGIPTGHEKLYAVGEPVPVKP